MAERARAGNRLLDIAAPARMLRAAAFFQQDAILTNSDPASTSHWSAAELVETLVQLDIPADIPAGEYEMRLVVYDFATLKPTVEIGVWEPEYCAGAPADVGSPVRGGHNPCEPSWLLDEPVDEARKDNVI